MSSTEQKPPASRQSVRVQHEAEAGVSGALAGAAMGAIGGPPGAVAGAVIGGLVGVLAGVALEKDAAKTAAHDAELDEEIGVAGGDLGAPNLQHPPAVRGTYSAAATGTDGTARDSAPAEGPMPPGDS